MSSCIFSYLHSTGKGGHVHHMDDGHKYLLHGLCAHFAWPILNCYSSLIQKLSYLCCKINKMLAYRKVISTVEDYSVHTNLGRSDDPAFSQTYVLETTSSFPTTMSGSLVGRDCATPSMCGLSVEAPSVWGITTMVHSYLIQLELSSLTRLSACENRKDYESIITL